MQARDANSMLIKEYFDVINKDISTFSEKVIETSYMENSQLIQSHRAFEMRISLLQENLLQMKTYLISVHPEEKDKLEKEFDQILILFAPTLKKQRFNTPEEFFTVMKELLKIRPQLMKVVTNEINYHEHRQPRNLSIQDRDITRMGPMSFQKNKSFP